MESSCCDCCSSPLDWNNGYLLSTTTVVLSVPYWESKFTTIKSMVGLFDERQQANAFTGSVRNSAQSSTPWLVCGDCVTMFVVDYDEARSYALSRVDPPKTGAVDPGGCAQIAAIAWEIVFGRWPASVQQPKADDSCDFCGRRLYQGEYCGVLPSAARNQLAAIGDRSSAALRPPRPDRDGWLTCMGCMTRLVAKQRAAEEGR